MLTFIKIRWPILIDESSPLDIFLGFKCFATNRKIESSNSQRTLLTINQLSIAVLLATQIFRCSYEWQVTRQTRPVSLSKSTPRMQACSSPTHCQGTLYQADSDAELLKTEKSQTITTDDKEYCKVLWFLNALHVNYVNPGKKVDS